MVKILRIPVLVLICILFFTTLDAQTDSIKHHKIAVFAPIYLDSAFDRDTVYRYGKNEFPKFINPGLEFYEGIQIAADSFSRAGTPLELYIYDTRSVRMTLDQQLLQAERDSVELIIAYISASEIRKFAAIGLRNHIPVINVNIPNDGGVTANPFFVLLNPTLKTQCEGIYRYLQKFYALNKIIVFRKKGILEDRIRQYFTDAPQQTSSVQLNLKYIDLPDFFTDENLLPYLDTLQTTVCVAGSLDESFGKRLALQLAALKKQKYLSVLMGMPTWDVIKDFSKPEYKGLEIFFSTPFYNARTDKTSQQIIDYFNGIMYARPSDMVMRGYETLWRFGNLLVRYPSDIASNITHREFNVFREYNIQPVLNAKTLELDYFENKKLYFLKWQDGILKLVN